MSDTSQKIPVNIEDEMKRSYMDYAMSVIIGRALPDARDGLKPAHRRVLYGMKTMGLASNRAYRKCAKIVGEVMGNFHPHGDASIYDTLVRLEQYGTRTRKIVNSHRASISSHRRMQLPLGISIRPARQYTSQQPREPGNRRAAPGLGNTPQ